MLNDASSGSGDYVSIFGNYGIFGLDLCVTGPQLLQCLVRYPRSQLLPLGSWRTHLPPVDPLRYPVMQNCPDRTTYPAVGVVVNPGSSENFDSPASSGSLALTVKGAYGARRCSVLVCASRYTDGGSLSAATIFLGFFLPISRCRSPASICA